MVARLSTLIYLDRACTQPFPFALPPQESMRIHLIVVAHNTAKTCISYFGETGSGSLIFDSAISGEGHYRDIETCRPFETGWIDRDRTFVHVLDDTSFEVVMASRDTISDFCEYLSWKEQLFRSAEERSVRISCTGEEELLAKYVLSFQGDRHGFPLPDNQDIVFFTAGGWENFLLSPQHSAQKEADEVSYTWDLLIETFSKHILGGTSYDDSTRLIADREKIIRFFARETRLRRRSLSELLLGLIAKTTTDRGTRVVIPWRAGDPHYCFLVFGNPFNAPYDEYRTVRAHLLEALCRVTKVIYPDALDIVGLATDTDAQKNSRSEDALYLNARDWDAEAEENARSLQKEFGLLVNLTHFSDKSYEFPIPDEPIMLPPPPGRNPRNKPCPCASGKKWKKCHGR